MGYQIFVLVNGVDIYKLCFGYCGFNYFVCELLIGWIDFISQNYGYVVDLELVFGIELEVIYIEINDEIVMGVCYI